MKYINQTLLTVGLFLLIAQHSVFAKEQLTAVVEWAQRVDLTIPVEGIVKKVLVNTGQKVKKGQVLVELDKRIVLADLRQAKAALNAVRANYEEVKRELERAQELYDRTVLSDHDLQVAKNNEVIAKSKLEQAKANYVKAQVALEYASLRAPFDSIILHRAVEVGKAIIKLQAYDTLITLASSNKYLAVAPLNQAQATSIAIGDKVSVLDNDNRYTGKVTAIEYMDANTTTAFRLVVEFGSDNHNLHAGSVVKVSF